MSGELTASQLLRAGLLEGVSLLVARPAGEARLAAALAEACRSLGGSVAELRLDGEDEEATEQALGGLLARAGHIDMLAVDCAALYADAQRAEERLAVHACLERTWSATRAVASCAYLAAGRGGRIVYLAPPPQGEGALATRAALENLARTLSIEWARHQVSAVTIAPGADSAAGETAALVAYLASPAGAYFSGCLLSL